MLRKIEDDVCYIGCSNPTQEEFEGEIPLVDGMSYNSYLTLDEKTCLQDTVDLSVVDEFIANLKEALNGRNLDCIVVHHLEPDHTSAMLKVLELYPSAKVYISAMGYTMFQNFFQTTIKNVVIVKEGDVLSLGKHQLTFFAAQMVHWPEVIMTYDSYNKTLYSADAFGAFYQTDELSIKNLDFNKYLDESRRYYTNIIGKYGPQVLIALAKALKFEIKKICSLHGPILDDEKSINQILDKYKLWASFTQEKKGVLICYCSIYGNTKKAADSLFMTLQNKGVDVSIINLNHIDTSYALSQSFIYKDIVILCPTFNNDIYPKMEMYLSFLKARMIKNKRFTIIENGSWVPAAGKIIGKILSGIPGNEISPLTLTIKSSLKPGDYTVLNQIAEDLAIKER